MTRNSTCSQHIRQLGATFTSQRWKIKQSSPNEPLITCRIVNEFRTIYFIFIHSSFCSRFAIIRTVTANRLFRDSFSLHLIPSYVRMKGRWRHSLRVRAKHLSPEWRWGSLHVYLAYTVDLRHPADEQASTSSFPKALSPKRRPRRDGGLGWTEPYTEPWFMMYMRSRTTSNCATRINEVRL